MLAEKQSTETARSDNLARFPATLLRLGVIILLAFSLALPSLTAQATNFYARDEFSTVAYNNNDGTVNWAGNWTEANDDGQANSGAIRIIEYEDELRMRINGQPSYSQSIRRTVDLSTAATASLSFAYETSGNLDSDDVFRVQVSTNGGTSYTTLESFTDDSSGGRVYDLTSYRTAATIIRFRVASDYDDSDEFMYVDNVEVSYFTSSTHTSTDVLPTVQTYYVPLPEDQALTTIQTIFPGSSACGLTGVPAAVNPAWVYISVSIVADDTVIYFDQWEDGYETRVNDPQQSTTEVWGDNDDTNGRPPGFANDLLEAGDIIILTNPVNTTQLSLYDFDGGDKFASTQAIAMTRASWATGSGTLLGGAIEMLDTSVWGTRYDVPVSNSVISNEMFEITGLAVMAAYNDTDIYRNGSQVTTLDEGQSYLFTAVSVGDILTSTHEVQAHLLTGDRCDYYESSYYTLYPTDLLGSSYYAPVSTNSTYPTRAFLFNTNSTSITVYWETTSGSGSYTVTARSTTVTSDIPDGSGAHFYTSNGSKFTAISVIDVASQGGGGYGNAFDWGYTLIPENQLTQQALVGWGPGQDPTITPFTENGSPVWVMGAVPEGSGSVQVCVDRDGDGTGLLTDSNGRHYDQLLTINNLQRVAVYDNDPVTDRDQTGMLLYVCDGSDSKIAVAWGEQPGVATAGAPGLDVGTAIPPLPDFVAVKGAELTGDANGNGRFDVGDSFAYNIVIRNSGALPIPLNSIVVSDIVPEYTLYVADSTTFDNGTTIDDIPDNTSPETRFPLDEGGWRIDERLPIEGVFTVTFQVRINYNLPGATTIQNQAYVNGLDLEYDPHVEIVVQPPDNNSRLGDRVWFDLNGDGVQDAGEPGIPGVVMEISNGLCNIGVDCPTTVTDASGIYTFTNMVPDTNYTVIVASSSLASNMTQTYDLDGTLNDQTTVLITAGNVPFTTADFGYRGLGSIGDRLWQDNDGDGVQDAGEPGLSGVTVDLTWAGLDGVLGTWDDLTFSKVTGADGAYQFSYLPPGNYSVSVDTTTLAAGLLPTGDPGESGTCLVCDSAHTLSLSLGETRSDVDFGYQGSAALGDLVWLDADGDGVADIGEPGLPNVEVRLYDALNNLVATTFTGADGRYLFTNLPAGTYTVDVAGGVPAGLSIAPGSSDPTAPITLTGGETNLEADFGYRNADSATAIIGDLVWSDADGDGLRDPGEPGLGGVTLALKSAGADGVLGTADDVTTATTTTTGDGSYYFSSVAPGEYIVEVTDTGGVLAGYSLTSGSDPTLPISVLGGQTWLNADFGYQPPASQDNSLGNFVWYDLDADGVQDGGETGISGVSVSLVDDLDGDGVWDSGEPIIATQLSAADGSYLFDGLPDGNYLVWASDVQDVLHYTGQIPPASHIPAAFQSGDPDVSGRCVGAACDALGSAALDPASTNPAGVNDASLDFGYALPGVVGDRVWSDADGDGLQDPGEPGIGGVTVRLYRDANGDGVFNPAVDTLVETTTTAADGAYLFQTTGAGTYFVDIPTPPAGYSLTTTDEEAYSGAQNQVDLAAGQGYLQADFGYRNASLYTLSGSIWNDLNEDARDDGASEPPIAGVTVALLDASGNVIAETTTLPDGSYAFTGVANGSYTVRVTDQAGVLNGYHLTSGTDAYDVTVSGASISNLDFGYVRSSLDGAIGDRIWYDLDADGDQDITEAGLVNVLVNLYSDTNLDGVGDTLLGSQYTGADGYYLFDGLGSGSYLIEVDASNFNAGRPLAGMEPTSGGNIYDYIQLTSGNPNRTGAEFMEADLGYRGTDFSLGNFVWSDADNDGLQDPGEPGISGVTLELLDQNDNFLASTTTLADGSYLFSSLAEGTYKVRVAASNFNPGGPLQGFAVTTGPQSTGANITLNTLLNTTYPAHSDLDFGYYQSGLGVIGDYVWLDKDIDGVPEAGEPPLENVTLDLIWDQDGDGVRDPGEPVIASTYTNASGAYSFTGLDLDDGGGNISYLVQVTDLFGVLEGMNPTSGTSNPQQSVLTPAAPSDLNNDFGYDDPMLGDYVWHDADNDGLQDASESGIQGVEMLLYLDVDNDGNLDPGVDNLIRTTTTDAGGYYYFSGLPFDNFIIKASERNFLPGAVLDGFAASPANQGSDDALDSDAVANNLVAVTPLSAKDFTQDFGFNAPTGYTIGNQVWQERVIDGYFDSLTEQGIDGVTVALFRDLNQNGVLDPEDPQIGATTTSGSGLYAFNNLPDGYYIVQVNDENLRLDDYAWSDGQDDTDNYSQTPTYCVQVNGANVVLADSGYYQPYNDPTAVTLTGFQALALPGEALLSWETIVEIDLLGFNIYRSSDTQGNDKILLTPESLEPQGGTQPGNTRYSFSDPTAQPGETYTYWLVVVNADGTTTLVGSLTITLHPPLYLPVILHG